jgi:aspartyl-tRNA(Asn)/glutamyl-tRNA(Gln) amidotransferase subunit A
MLGLSLTELLKGIQEKKFTSSEVNDYFIKRINKYDTDLNCYLALNAKLSNNKSEGILKGLALAIKDNFSTAGIITTASSKVLDNYKPEYDATVVSKLKKAGAFVQGKTNMDAWAHGSSTETSDYGVTMNPYDSNRVAGGSSGGSAAATAAYLTPASIGSETAGSVRGPAAWSGAIGLKPTYGRVSRYGVVAMGSSWDCPGPITTTVSDAALLLEIIAGKDIYDGTTSEAPVEAYVKNIDEKRNSRLAYQMNTYTI